MSFHVYILRNKQSGRYYIGHTDNLERRLTEHNDPERSGEKYTKRYPGAWHYVYHEEHATRAAAMARERAIKAKKSRQYIEQLIASRQSPEGARD